ncbi:hypothetical protein LTR82_002704 [Friedmanniomyces endolithicus]|uniref:Protein kinase domain-containing protein n=1 Tax=Friedmanniomyces endolithicus TaxID=329885 RepID=A0AAN6JDE8_9PEZI|nr:hypothetical protein LTR82_002704 [Friedmanniomyces endolithicus]
MPPVRNQAEYESQEQRAKLAASYQSLLREFASPDLQSVGNYTLGRLIGKGSFGKVYLASHKLTNGAKVVLKSAKKDDANLAREIHHHRQFLHPHIARLYEVIVTEKLVWLALEYCPGDELYDHVLKHGRMEAGKVQKIFTQLVGAVSYVHGKSCVHRDLKLENILLDKHENVKLVDFGFTREYQGATSYLQTWCGTVCYSAPEMLKGEKYAGERVDVWSLGVILYALLCGELPYDEDDDAATKLLILKEEPKFPDYMPEPAKELIKKLLSKRPILRPPLGDILRDPWLADHAPLQQEILKLQQPPAFSTQVEKETLQRMRSAGVDIDVIIENVLSQRCDSLAGWWALLIEKEQRKEKRRERKRKEKEAEAKSIRRLSAASSRLLAQSALGEIYEEGDVLRSPSARGRRMARPNGSLSLQSPELPRVVESKSPTSDDIQAAAREASRSRSRPAPPPKDLNMPALGRPRVASRGNSMLRYSTVNPDLLSPTYVPPPQRKRRTFYPQPLKEQLAWVKHWFKEGAKRAKSPNPTNNAEGGKKGGKMSPSLDSENGVGATTMPSQLAGASIRDLQRTHTGPLPQHRKASVGHRPDLQSRATMPARPRINTASSTDSRTSMQRKRSSLSPHTLTPHASYHRRSSAGLRGRKSTSSSVSSIRSAYQSVGGGGGGGGAGGGKGHHHSHSKASSTSSASASLASPSGISNASGSKMGRSPHASVKVLPSTPTGTNFPSGIRVSRRPPPGGLGTLPVFAGSDMKGAFGVGPGSPSLPVFARRKRSVFKGPMGGGSPSGFGGRGGGNSRSGSGPRRSGEMIMGITEEDEEEGEAEDAFEDEEVDEELDQFGPELLSPGGHAESLSTKRLNSGALVISSAVDSDSAGGVLLPALADGGSGKTPLTAEALAKMEEQEKEKG